MMFMDSTDTLAVYGGLFLAGLASSLHCIGMCGPILVGFSQAFEKVSLTVNGQGRASRMSWDLLWYHVGRIWTYGALGFIVGLLGKTLQEGSAWIGWQYATGLVMSTAVILSGVALVGIIPGLNIDRFLAGCAISRWQTMPWLHSLVRSQGAMPRLLLGAVMGLLPCGLIYAMLAVVAGLAGPWRGAMGMVSFGLGTLPSLWAAVWMSHFIPQKLRAHGTTVTAVMVIVAGVWMMGRTILPHSHGAHGHEATEPHDAMSLSSK